MADLDGMLQYYIKRPEARRFAGGVGLSALLHASVAAAVLIGATPDHAGGGATTRDEISVMIVSTADAQSAAPTTAPVATDRAMPAPELPATDASTEANVTPPEPAVQQLVEPPEPRVPLSPLDVALLASPPVVDQPHVREAPTPTKDRAADAAQSGSLSAASVSVGGAAVGEAAASRGDIDRYAREVALVVVRRRPTGVGMKGTVTIEFTLAPASGAVVTATVIKSSGSAKLETLARVAIEQGKFPAPPVGMAAQQLTYRVPFTFE